jgi:predicted nucleic acid-binding protein
MPNRRKIVLDTNCLIASLSRHSEYYSVWKDFQAGKYTLCVSTSILQEYEEIIGHKTSVVVAKKCYSVAFKEQKRGVYSTLFQFSSHRSRP